MSRYYFDAFFEALDSLGIPDPGATLTFYETNTTTPKNTYQEAALTTPNTNPVVADGTGRFPEMYLQSGLYSIVYKDADGATIKTIDDFNGAGSGTGDVIGPASSTDHVWPRFDSTTGKLLQDGSWAEDDSGDVVAGGAINMNGNVVNMGGGSINESEGAAVASATTTDIFGGDDGNTLHITGTTTIVDFTDASNVGQWRKIIFDDVLTLTDGSGITLPGGANITTAAGDYAFVYADAVDAFAVLYFRADGTSIVTSGIVLGIEEAASGTSNTLSIPSGSKRVVLFWEAISWTGTVNGIVQIGDAGGIEATGYVSSTFSQFGTAISAAATSTTSFLFRTASGAGDEFSGTIILELMNASTNTWLCHSILTNSAGNAQVVTSGIKSLSAELSQIQISGGTFDNGSFNVSYE